MFTALREPGAPNIALSGLIALLSVRCQQGPDTIEPVRQGPVLVPVSRSVFWTLFMVHCNVISPCKQANCHE
ncbi:hypothetical protein EI94DRAFT_1712107 [Lactarius quietus]|nr:hypothetical protein EI94DRAFT_1712107 [Lactarius quietus]